MKWTPENTRALKLMWRRGATYGQIAIVLGVSRNAVAGKCKRLGLVRFHPGQSVRARLAAA